MSGVYPLIEYVRGYKGINILVERMYHNLQPLFHPAPRGWRDQVPYADLGRVHDHLEPRVAFICDEMTWQHEHPWCRAVFLHPQIWREQIERFQPDLLFCEAAWSGINQGKNCWRGQIYRDQRVPFENRKALLAILSLCKSRGIPTVFWNKEDPVYFDDPKYNFVDTALRFDQILTTAEECVPRYQALGGNRVSVFPFRVNTELFSAEGAQPQKDTVVFGGSWYADHPARCEALATLLDYVLQRGWKLDIYNRKSTAPESRFQFPKRYQPYIKPAVPYTEIPKVFQRYEYAINVNTETESETMLSRRILELAAVGIKILTNESAALHRMEGITVEAMADGKDILCVQSNPQVVKEKYGAKAQFQALIEQVKMDARKETCGIGKARG